MTKIRVAIWGLGHHVRRNILPAFERTASAELVAVHTRREGVLREVAERTRARPYRDSAALLAAHDIDVVYVATPTGLHAAMATAAIQSGKHVWCEKPMTTSYEETQLVVASAIDAGLVALESDMFLHHPQFAEFKRLMESNTVGSVVSITARFGFPHRSLADFRYAADLGGGAILDAGFYTVAAAVALVGPKLRLAGATVATRAGMEVDTGGTALVVSSDCPVMLDWGFGRAYRSEIEAWCEEGSLTAARAFSKPADLATHIAIRTQQGDGRTVPVAPADQFAVMLDDFAAITLGEVSFDPEPTLARARLLTEIREVGRSLD